MESTNHPEWMQPGSKVAIVTPNRGDGPKVTTGIVTKLLGAYGVVVGFDQRVQTRSFRLQFNQWSEFGPSDSITTLHPLGDPAVLRAMARQRRAEALSAVSESLNWITKQRPDCHAEVINPGRLAQLLEAVQDLIEANDEMRAAE